MDAGAAPLCSAARRQPRRRVFAVRGSSNAQSAHLLIEAGAQVNTRDCRGRTPLHTAGEPQIAVVLLEAHADWTIRDYEGRTAVEYDRKWGLGEGRVAEAIEKWVAARERAEALSDDLAVSDDEAATPTM